MNIVICGSGPLPLEPEFPVLDPGARTWQITQTAAAAFEEIAGTTITVFGLETTRREDSKETIAFRLGGVQIRYVPLVIEQYLQLPFNTRSDPALQKLNAVI